MIDTSRIEKFLDDQEQVKAVKEALLSFVWFSPEEFNEFNGTALTNEQIGEITRCYAIATEMLKKSFKELEKFRKIKSNQVLDVNPAR
jgi:hypothetical protein